MYIDFKLYIGLQNDDWFYISLIMWSLIFIYSRDEVANFSKKTFEISVHLLKTIVKTSVDSKAFI